MLMRGDVDERRITSDQVAGSYASLIDAAMTVSRSESYFFLLLSGGAGGEPVGDSDELVPTAKSSDARAALERPCRPRRAKSARSVTELRRRCDGRGKRSVLTVAKLAENYGDRVTVQCTQLVCHARMVCHARRRDAPKQIELEHTGPEGSQNNSQMRVQILSIR
jgi:hypothetical protein